jgi:hypothetical protein
MYLRVQLEMNMSESIEPLPSRNPGVPGAAETTPASAAARLSARPPRRLCYRGRTAPYAPPAVKLDTPPNGTPSEMESLCDFSWHDADGELVIRQDCPEFGGGAGGRGGGVKAVEGYRSPSPGGATERSGADAQLWGVRRGVSEADGEWVGLHKMPESRCDFSWHDADGELLMWLECPERKKG